MVDYTHEIVLDKEARESSLKMIIKAWPKETTYYDRLRVTDWLIEKAAIKNQDTQEHGYYTSGKKYVLSPVSILIFANQDDQQCFEKYSYTTFSGRWPLYYWDSSGNYVQHWRGGWHRLVVTNYISKTDLTINLALATALHILTSHTESPFTGADFLSSPHGQTHFQPQGQEGDRKGNIRQRQRNSNNNHAERPHRESGLSKTTGMMAGRRPKRTTQDLQTITGTPMQWPSQPHALMKTMSFGRWKSDYTQNKRINRGTGSNLGNNCVEAPGPQRPQHTLHERKTLIQAIQQRLGHTGLLEGTPGPGPLGWPTWPEAENTIRQSKRNSFIIGEIPLGYIGRGL